MVMRCVKERLRAGTSDLVEDRAPAAAVRKVLERGELVGKVIERTELVR